MILCNITKHQTKVGVYGWRLFAYESGRFNAVEDGNHLFFSCLRIQQVWYLMTGWWRWDRNYFVTYLNQTLNQNRG
jgi:hypothetical protein